MFAARLSATAARLAPVIARRGLASTGAATKGASNQMVKVLAAGAAAGVAVSMYEVKEAKAEGSILSWIFGESKPTEWEAVRKEIAEIFEDNPDNGPFFVRLAWHCAGSYDKNDNTGGSNGATMRFSPEANHGGNAGLNEARDLLESVKAAHPNLTYADIYTFAGVAAIEAMGGPKIKWEAGRTDFNAGEGVTPDGRLPDATQGPEHLRSIFYRMGFNDQEIVALSGAHSLGFCHDDRSGFVGPWTDTPHDFSNKYFQYMLNKKWQLKKWDGPAQFENADDGTLMMLPTDMALLTDTSFRQWVDLYAADNDAFAKDFAAAFHKLLELGVPRS